MYTREEIKKLGPIADGHFPGMELTKAFEDALGSMPEELGNIVLISQVIGLIGGFGKELVEFLDIPIQQMPGYIADPAVWKRAIAEWRMQMGH